MIYVASSRVFNVSQPAESRGAHNPSMTTPKDLPRAQVLSFDDMANRLSGM